ncbi:unnamed protein product [Peniophora sp. CBMAI 1063]|nr:unnamed protein product [Peniophora sp. CBMAI 1063]
MCEINIRRLENPTGDDIDAIAKILATAFADDVFTLVCGGDASKIYDFERATVAAVALAGEIWVASYGDQDFASVALWIRPDRDLLDSPDQHEAGFGQLFSSFKTELSQWWMTMFLPRYGEMNTEALGARTKVENWNLQMVATLPDLQRRGLASTLMKVVEDKAKAENKLITLEVAEESNLAFYRHLGWKVVYGPEHFDAIEGLSFPMWIMTS